MNKIFSTINRGIYIALCELPIPDKAGKEDLCEGKPRQRDVGRVHQLPVTCVSTLTRELAES